MRITRIKLAFFLLLTVMTNSGALAEWAPNVKPGQKILDVTAIDQDGKVWSNSSHNGKNGYLLLFNRSVVW